MSSTRHRTHLIPELKKCSLALSPPKGFLFSSSLPKVYSLSLSHAHTHTHFCAVIPSEPSLFEALFSTHIVGDKPILVSHCLCFSHFLYLAPHVLLIQMMGFLENCFSIGQVRDFIHSALYDAKHGYFSQRSGSVGVLEKSIKFNQLKGAYSISDFTIGCILLESFFFFFLRARVHCDLGFEEFMRNSRKTIERK
jgi:hypothetical protein